MFAQQERMDSCFHRKDGQHSKVHFLLKASSVDLGVCQQFPADTPAFGIYALSEYHLSLGWQGIIG